MGLGDDLISLRRYNRLSHQIRILSENFGIRRMANKAGYTGALRGVSVPDRVKAHIVLPNLNKYVDMCIASDPRVASKDL